MADDGLTRLERKAKLEREGKGSPKEHPEGRGPGDKVRAKFRNEGWLPGTIVRLIDRPGDSPLYVVDVGRYESIIVTESEIRGG